MGKMGILRARVLVLSQTMTLPCSNPFTLVPSHTRINLRSYLRSGPGCPSGTWPTLPLCSHSVLGPLAIPGTCWVVPTLGHLPLQLSAWDVLPQECSFPHFIRVSTPRLHPQGALPADQLKHSPWLVSLNTHFNTQDHKLPAGRSLGCPGHTCHQH